MISAELMYEKVMHRMDMTKETKEEELQEIIRTVLEDESKKEFYSIAGNCLMLFADWIYYRI